MSKQKETKEQEKPAKEKLSAEKLFIDSCKSWTKCGKAKQFVSLNPETENTNKKELSNAETKT
ncbi:MAG: hypothetical protein LBK82_13995 [Planctomycetaceae bacterium]|jgi:hypothetical protein|nr:hypothetical protein [Planctomycetaceae bacterium]